MDKIIVTILLSFSVALVIFAFFFYATSLGNRKAITSQSEKYGRSQYLIDIRWPSFDFKKLFSD